MSVMTSSQYSAMGDMLGSWDSAKKNAESIDFVRKAFEAFDTDKSGFLDPQEMRAALVMLGVKPTMEALLEMGLEDRDGDGKLSIEDLDKDGDQKIDYEEVRPRGPRVCNSSSGLGRWCGSCVPRVP